MQKKIKEPQRWTPKQLVDHYTAAFYISLEALQDTIDNGHSFSELQAVSAEAERNVWLMEFFMDWGSNGKRAP